MTRLDHAFGLDKPPDQNRLLPGMQRLDPLKGIHAVEIVAQNEVDHHQVTGGSPFRARSSTHAAAAYPLSDRHTS